MGEALGGRGDFDMTHLPAAVQAQDGGDAT